MSGKSVAKKIALLAVMTALIVAGKAVLSAVANVEIVSLFCALFGYVFGPIATVPTCLFILIDMLYWGSMSYYSWIPTYFIHFNSIVIIFWLLSKAKLKTPVVHAIIIVFMTFCFGLIESFFAVIMVSTDFNNFIYRFGVYYGRGVAFSLVHIVSNAVIFLLLFIPLKELLVILKKQLEL